MDFLFTELIHRPQDIGKLRVANGRVLEESMCVMKCTATSL